MANRKSGASLVVGVSGQVGSQVMQALGFTHAVGTSRYPRNAEDLFLDLALLAGQPLEAQRLLQRVQASAVYCIGAATDVEHCESHEHFARLVNCEGPATLAAAAADRGIPFVFFSSEYVFSGNAGPYTEDALPDPISVYGRSKLLGELAVAQSHPSALIIRTTVVYGLDLRAKNFLYGLRRALLAGEPFYVASDQISTPTYNVDLAKAVIQLVEAGGTGVVHVSGSERLSRLDFALQAARIMGLEIGGIIAIPTAQLGQRAPRPLSAGLLTNRLQEICPDVHIRTIDAGIRHWLAALGSEHIG
jgi:dTDP-4-dehydrorhamnose reductase